MTSRSRRHANVYICKYRAGNNDVFFASLPAAMFLIVNRTRRKLLLFQSRNTFLYFPSPAHGTTKAMRHLAHSPPVNSRRQTCSQPNHISTKRSTGPITLYTPTGPQVLQPTHLGAVGVVPQITDSIISSQQPRLYSWHKHRNKHDSPEAAEARV